MTDEEFINKLDDIIFKYGYVIIDIHNYKYYFDRYKLKNYYEKEYSEAEFFFRFQLFNVTMNMVEFGFKSIDMIINDHLSLFELVKQDIYRTVKYFPVDFVNFITTIYGTSKEEILLKLQMMGY